MKAFILEESKNFKPGQIVEADSVSEKGIQVEECFLENDSYVLLNEALTPKDEERVKTIIRDLLKKVFWRIYTRNSFILQ